MADSVARVLEQWRRERPDIDSWPIGVVGRLMRLSRLWDKEIKDFLAARGLESGEFDVLSTLRRSGEPYRLTAGAFRAASLVTSGAVTNRIDRMAAKGLVERVPDATDRRAVLIGLTSRGLDLVNDLLPLHIANEARLLQALDVPDRQRLAETLLMLLISHGDTSEPS